MSIETPEELEHLKAAGRIVAEAIRAMRAHVRPGVSTGELDKIGERVFARAGARSGPQLDYGFPGVNCISVNDEAVHGIPGKRRLRNGDLVNQIGRAIETCVTGGGYAVCPDLMGHGIGRRIHEPPNIPNYDAPGFSQPLTEGLVITIEPIIAAGDGAVRDTGDGWTIKTQDGSYNAHTEHTIVVTHRAPLILTA